MNLSARAEAIRQAKQYLAKRPVYLDTETTGVGSNAEIVEVGIVDYDGSVLVDTLVKPRGRIEPGAQRVHKITKDMLADALYWEAVWPQVEAALKGRYVGIYNLDFDLRMLRQSHKRSWMQWREPAANFLCVMRLYAKFYGQWNSKRGSYRWQGLDKAGQQCGLNLPNSHRAADDTLLTRAVLHYMANSK
ncbi:MAG: 3'-5' exonuclease [Chloroflexota bacterium]|nr:3'-5' exonuclease [Chloroflexota bacterium]